MRRGRMYLTKRQKQVLDYIAGFLDERGYAPALEEIGEHFGLSSPATVYKHVQQLVSKGYLSKARNQGRGLELTNGRDAEVCEAPLRGVLTGGPPSEMLETIETIDLPPAFATGEPVYALRVRGNSMLDDLLVDGDILVLEDRVDPRDGETVLVVLQDRRTAVRRYYCEKGVVRLQPRRLDGTATLVPEHQVRVQGVVVGLLRSYR